MSRGRFRLIIAVAAAVAAVLAALLYLRYIEAFSVVGRIPSPDSSMRLLVYERVMDYAGEKMPAVTVTTGRTLRDGSTSYPRTAYSGAWWSPDSRKYVVELVPLNDDGLQMTLTDLDRNSGTNLGVVVRDAMTRTALADYGFQQDDTARPITDLHFSQWSGDGTAMKFRYAFTDIRGEEHSGTFWYHLSSSNGLFHHLENTIDTITEDEKGG